MIKWSLLSLNFILEGKLVLIKSKNFFRLIDVYLKSKDLDCITKPKDTICIKVIQLGYTKNPLI